MRNLLAMIAVLVIMCVSCGSNSTPVIDASAPDAVIVEADGGVDVDAADVADAADLSDADLPD
jgi:hypothetical protein